SSYPSAVSKCIQMLLVCHTLTHFAAYMVASFFFSSRRRHTRSVSAFLLNRSSDLSYYPSECHADYFDFERIEALKPAIEACGISTLSQSPMLGFHKQMDNRIKLLEEILSFRMQGVEFDNGDMYVD